MKTERKIEVLLKFAGSEITPNSNDDYSEPTDLDYAVEQESTADGYEVYTFQHPSDHICLCENVFYYDNDLPELITEALTDGETLIYIDEYLYEDLGIEEHLEESFVEFVEDFIAQESDGKGDNILTKEELKELKEEYYVEDEN